MNGICLYEGLVLLLFQTSEVICESECFLQIAPEFSHYQHSYLQRTSYAADYSPGVYVFHKFGENDSLEYYCKDGFTLIGSDHVECSESKWTSPPPRCYENIAQFSSLNQRHQALVDGSADTGIIVDHLFPYKGFINVDLYKEYSLKAVKIIIRSDLSGTPISITVRAGIHFWNYIALNTDDEHIIYITDDISNNAAITGWNQLTSLKQLQLSIELSGSDYINNFNDNVYLADIQILTAPKMERCVLDSKYIPEGLVTAWRDSGQCFYHFPVQQTHLQAEKICQLYLGTELVYIKSSGMLLRVVNNLRIHANFSENTFWIYGFRDIFNKKLPAGHCLAVHREPDSRWIIRTRRCDTTATVICQTEFSGCAAPPSNDNYQGQSSGWFPEGMSLGVGCMDGNNTQTKCLSGKWEPENICQLISTQPNTTSDAGHEESITENNAVVTALIGCNLAWILLLLYFIVYRKMNTYMLKQRKRSEGLRSELQSRTGYTNNTIPQSRSKDGKRLYEYID